MGAGFSSKKRPTVVALTPRVLLCWLPSKAKEASAALSELAAQLTSLKFMIFNVSGSTYDASQFQQQLLDVPCPLDFPPSLESTLSLCLSIESFLTASPLNVAVIQGSQDAWQADLLAAALLLFTRFTADPRTALAFVAYRVAQFAYIPPPPSFVRATHFTAMLLRHEPRQNSAPLRLRFLIVHSVPALDTAGGCRPLLELLDEDGAPLWSNCAVAAGTEPTDEQLRALPHFSTRRGDSSMPFQIEPAPLVDGDFSLRVAHIDAGERGVTKRPMFSAWHHTAFIDGEALVLRLASSQFDVRPELRGEIDDEFALDLIFAAEPGVSQSLRPTVLKLPTDVDRCGECLFPNGEIDVVTTKRALASFTDKELTRRADEEENERVRRAKAESAAANKASRRGEKEDPVAARLAARTRAARRLRERYAKFFEMFGLPVDEVPLGTFSCALVVASGKPLPGSLYITANFIAFHGSLVTRDLVFSLRDITSINDENKSTIYRKCINLTLHDGVHYTFTWVERSHAKETAAIPDDLKSSAAVIKKDDDDDDDDDDIDEAMLAASNDGSLSPLEQIDSLWRDCQASRNMRLAMGSDGALASQRDLFTQRDMSVLMLGATYRKLKRGEVLFAAGSPLVAVYKLSKGKAQAFVPHGAPPAVAATGAPSGTSSPLKQSASSQSSSSGATTPVPSRSSRLNPKQLMRRLHHSSREEDEPTPTTDADVAAPEVDHGVLLGPLGEANMPGELSYLLGEHVAMVSIVADGKFEAQEVPFKYIDEQIRASPALGERLFRFMARSLAGRMHSISARFAALTLRMLRLHPDRLFRSSTFGQALFTPALIARLPASDGRALPPTECWWTTGDSLDVRGTLWATPACVCFVADLFGFGTRQLLPIDQIVAARRRGSSEIEIELERRAMYVFGGFAQRDNVVEALMRVIATNRRATGREVTAFGDLAATADDAKVNAAARDLLMTDEDWRLLLAGARIETFARGDVIIAQGSAAAAVFQVVSGRVLVVIESGGRRLAVNVLNEGDVFGEMAFCAGVPATATVYAETSEVAAYVIDVAWLHATFTITPGLRLRFFRFVACGLAKRAHTTALALAAELALPDHDEAVYEAAERRLEHRYEKTVRHFYSAPPLADGTEWPTIVFEASCVLERRTHSYHGTAYISWTPAVYFRADRTATSFGKPLTLTLDYARIEDVRVVGDRASHQCTIEFELNTLGGVSGAAAAAPATAGGEESASAESSDSASSSSSQLERFCLTFASVEERRTFWDMFHKFCPRKSVGGGGGAEAAAAANAQIARRRSSLEHHDSIDVLRRDEPAAPGSATEDDATSTTLTTNEWQFLLSTVRVERFARGQVLIRGGELAKSSRRLFQLVSGQVKTVRAHARARKQAILGVQQSGSIMGELSLLLGGVALATVVAEDDVVAYSIDEVALRELLSLRPALAAAFDRKVLAGMARRLVFSYEALGAGMTLSLEPLVAATVRDGTLQRRGKAKWKPLHVVLHSDAFLSMTKQSASSGGSAQSKPPKLLNLAGYSADRANVKQRENIVRLTHPVQRALLLEASSSAECDAWIGALRTTIAEAAGAHRNGVVTASRRKVDVKFSERYNLPQTENLVAEFECTMRVAELPVRGKAREKQQRDERLLDLPSGAVSTVLQLSANYVGVHAKKGKYTKAIYLHGMTNDPELDDEAHSVTLVAGGLRFEWSGFAQPADAARVGEMLQAYMALGVAREARAEPGRASALMHLTNEDWAQLVSVCEAPSRVFERESVIVRQGHRSDSLYMLEQGRLRVVITARGSKPVQVACIEEGEIFGSESFFGVSGADFQSESGALVTDGGKVPTQLLSGAVASALRSVRRRKRASTERLLNVADDEASGSGGGINSSSERAGSQTRGSTSALQQTAPYSVVCDSELARVTVVRGAELRSLLRADGALRQKLLRHAAIGLARRVRAASTAVLERTMQSLEAESKQDKL
jgi:CRP-like cAMP-binding protein